LKLDRDKWQTDFEKQLDISEKKQIAIVKRFYKSEYNKGIESFIADGQTNFQLLFDNKPLLKIYRDLYTDIGMRFAKWYVNNFQKYIVKAVDTSNFDDIWKNTFGAFGSAMGAERVTLVAGTARQTLIRITQRLMTDPEFMTLGAVEKGRILRNQFNRYSQFQAERLVRTESTAAANFATSEAATTIFPGDQLSKEWIASFDDRTRSTHSEADGQIVDQNAPFTVGGFSMMFPGDPSAPAKEVINCRCSIAHIPKEGAQTIEEIQSIGLGVAAGGFTNF
jgi:ribosomal protein L7/L12